VFRPTLSPAPTELLTCDVSYAHIPDILHIDPTLLLFLEDREREIVYCGKTIYNVCWVCSVGHVQSDDVRYVSRSVVIQLRRTYNEHLYVS